MPRPHPVMPRVAHHPEAPPRDLFVPAVNERVGMNDRGRPSGSPLQPDRIGPDGGWRVAESAKGKMRVSTVQIETAQGYGERSSRGFQ